MKSHIRSAIAAVLVSVAVGCGRPVWDEAGLLGRFPALPAVEARVLSRATPYLLPSDRRLFLFLCRWTTDQPISVSIPVGLTRSERRALEAALHAWEAADLGVRFVRVEGGRASIEIELRDGPVKTAAGAGSGNTIADCALGGPTLPAPTAGILPAELRFASIRLARRTAPDVSGHDRALSQAELVGAALHELGHALGFQGHTVRGEGAMRADAEALRRTGATLLDGARFFDPGLHGLYALPSGTVLREVKVDKWRTDLLDRMARVAAQNGLVGPFARVGDVTARIYWRGRAGKEFGLQVVNLRQTLRRPGKLLVVPEARVRRVLPRSRDLHP